VSNEDLDLFLKRTRPIAEPKKDDFKRKYEHDGQSKIGGMLINNYFENIARLIDEIDLPIISAHEIGCGPGYSTQRLSHLMAETTYFSASEFVEAQLPMARKLNPELRIFSENVYDLKFKDNEFDLVFLLEVLEHLDEPIMALKEIKRVIRPGGHFILGVPREPLWRILNMARGKYLKDFGNTPGHINHWSTRRISKIASDNIGLLVSVRSPLPWTQVLVRINK